MNFLLSQRDRKTAFKYNIPVPLLQRGFDTSDIEKTNTVVVVPTVRNKESACVYEPKPVEGTSSASNVEPVSGPDVFGSKTPKPKIATEIIKVGYQILMVQILILIYFFPYEG